MYSKVHFYLHDIEKTLNSEYTPPVTIEVDPSNACMLDCSFCLYAEHLKENHQHMSMQMFTDLCINAKDIGVKSITFTGGGEPLVNPKIRDMIILAKSMGFELGLVTNGVSLDRIIDLVDKFHFIRVSLDSSNPAMYRKVKGADHFDRVIRNIKRVIMRDVFIGLSYVVCEDNVDGIQPAVQLSQYLGVRYIQFKPAMSNGETGTFTDYTVPDDPIIIETKRHMAKDDRPCKVAVLVGVVGAEGNVYFCCQKRGEKDYVLGNIKDESFDQIWRRHFDMTANVLECPRCRYMNFLHVYDKLVDEQTLDYLHRNFL